MVRLIADDGLRFDDKAMVADTIVEGAGYHGVRIRIPCHLGTIRNGIQVDVGFGDAVIPPPHEMKYPILVDGSAFSVYAYPLSTVIAEKFEAMVSLADSNSRMKDFWDIAFILENFEVPADELRIAIGATFAQRQTSMPENLLVFSTDFADSERSHAQWDSFIKRTKLPNKMWAEVLTIIRSRLKPIYLEIRRV